MQNVLYKNFGNSGEPQNTEANQTSDLPVYRAATAGRPHRDRGSIGSQTAMRWHDDPWRPAESRVTSEYKPPACVSVRKPKRRLRRWKEKRRPDPRRAGQESTHFGISRPPPRVHKLNHPQTPRDSHKNPQPVPVVSFCPDIGGVPRKRIPAHEQRSDFQTTAAFIWSAARTIQRWDKERKLFGHIDQSSFYLQ